MSLLLGRGGLLHRGGPVILLGPLAAAEQAELAGMLRTLLLTFESDDPLGG